MVGGMTANNPKPPAGGDPSVGAIASVNFRVRCEKLGHGEDVFLVQEDDTKMQKVRSFVLTFMTD